MKTAKLDKGAVNGLQAGDKPYVAWCGTLPGFGLSVRPSGSKTFIAQYDFGGRRGVTRRVTIGRFPLFTVEQARKQADTILRNAKSGIDHAETKAKRRAELTVAELCDEYLAEGCEHKKALTIATDKGRIERHIKPLLGAMKISDVRSKDIERFKKDVASGKTKVKRENGKGFIATGGQGAATRTVRLLGGIFSYAVKCEYITENPRKGVAVYADRKNERFLSLAELQRLGEALHEAETVGLPWQPKNGANAKHTPKKVATAREVVSAHAIAAIRLLMLTGCRAGEILTLQWSHVDMERGILNLPTSKTGAKKVLIGSAALKVLADLPRIKGNPYVIVGELADKPRSDLKRPWKRITTHAGLADVRLHDLRHSFASVGVASNFGLTLVGKLLGHASTSTTARYAHIADSAERRAANEIENTIAAAAGMIETAKIVPIQQSAA
jgi:integrase